MPGNVEAGRETPLPACRWSTRGSVRPHRIGQPGPGSGAPGPEPAAMPGNTRSKGAGHCRIAATTNSLMRLAP